MSKIPNKKFFVVALTCFCSITFAFTANAESTNQHQKKFYNERTTKTKTPQQEFVRTCVKQGINNYLLNNSKLSTKSKLFSSIKEHKKRLRKRCRSLIRRIRFDVSQESASINQPIQISAFSPRRVQLLKFNSANNEIATFKSIKNAQTEVTFPTAGDYILSAEFKFAGSLIYLINKNIKIIAHAEQDLAPRIQNTDIPESGTVDGSIQFNVHVLSDSLAALEYLWDFGDGSSATIKNPQHRYTQSGEYTARVTVNNAYGSSQASGLIQITSDNQASDDCAPPEQEEDAPYTDAGLWYEDFAKANLGALNEPLIYQYAGSVLKIDPASLWRHVSENSAAISWQTNLPTKGYIRYGTDSANLNQATPITRRFHEQHLKHLRGLSSDTPIYYRLCGIDERNEVVAGPIETITPTKIPNAKYIPGDLQGPPYVLTSGYYVLTENIQADTRAISIQGNDITLDLNGHKIVYDKGEPLVRGAWNDYVYSNISTFGVMVNGTRWKVLNGTIQQDPVAPANGNIGLGFNPIYGSNQGEIAGIHAIYSGDDVSGLAVRYGTVAVHHNRIDDYGSVITNRHQGIKAIHAAEGDTYNNYVSRARHQGIMGGDLVSSNVVHVDSGATNSFGYNLQGNTQERTLYGNRAYGTGYHVVAVGWKNGMQAINNYIFLVGLEQFDRSSEYGVHCSLNGFRLTQYTGSSNEFKDMNYLENVVSIHVNSSINQARPIQLMSNEYVSNILVSGNTFRTHVLDLDTGNATHNNKEFAAVVLHGSTPETANQIQYRNNTAISNYRILMGGDSYAGGGSNHFFFNNSFVREGNSAKFRFGRFGWWTPTTFNNRLLNTTLVGDMALDQPVFYGSINARQEYSVGSAYFAKIMDCSGNVLAGSEFVVSDSQGDVLRSTVPQNGITEIHELDYTMSGSQANTTGTKTIHTNALLSVSGRTSRALAANWKNQGKTKESAIQIYLGTNGNQCS